MERGGREPTEDFGVFKVHTEHSTILSIFQISLMGKWANLHVCSELSQKTDRGLKSSVERKADRGLGRKGRFQGDLAFSGGRRETKERKSQVAVFQAL